MRRKAAVTIIVILALAAAAGAYYYYSTPKASSPSPSTPEESQAVRTVVTEFGKRLQLVPLSASEDIVTAAIQENYAPYVSTALLADWQSDPSKAPGRLTSSPWPDRIEITSVVKEGEEFYSVQGKVIELTSQEVAHGGVAASFPVTIEVGKDANSGNWVITAYEQSAAQ